MSASMRASAAQLSRRPARPHAEAVLGVGQAPSLRAPTAPRAAANNFVAASAPTQQCSFSGIAQLNAAATRPNRYGCWWRSTRLLVAACASGHGSAAPGVGDPADLAAMAAPAPQPAAARLAAPYWRTYVSRQPLLLQALSECLAGIRRQGGPLPDVVDVALVYVSSEYLEDYGSLVEVLQREVPGLRSVFGCTGFGVIGVDEAGPREVEAQPALSLTLAALPQAEVIVRHLDDQDLPDGDAPPSSWSALLGGVPAFPESPLSLVVLSDPSFAAVQDLLAGLDFAFPTATKIGGLSSSSAFGGSRTATFCWSASPAQNRSAATAAPAAAVPDAAGAAGGGGSGRIGGANGSGGKGVYGRGASVLCIHGEVQMDLMIAQGCRPLSGVTWTVERVAAGRPTHVAELSSPGVGRGRTLPALEAFQIELQSVLSGMSEAQLRRTVSNLTVGVAPPGEGLRQSPEPQPQDFLIRALRGFDSEQCLVVGEYMRVGQRVRFMVRDKQGAQEDLASHGLSYKRKQLQAMLQGGKEQQAAAPFGMLMFTCNGRGSGLYGEDSYDVRTMSSYVPVPCAGFQCNGEIGRVGDTTHLHGFTCAVGVLRLTAAADVGPAAPAAGAGGTSDAAGTSASPPPPEKDEEPSGQQ